MRARQVRQDGVVGVAHVGVDPDPPVAVGHGDEALRQPDGRADMEVAVDGGQPAPRGGENDVQVTERELDAPLVARRQVARRGGPRGRVEIGRGDRLKAPDEDGAGLDAHPSLDQT